MHEAFERRINIFDIENGEFKFFLFTARIIILFYFDRNLYS